MGIAGFKYNQPTKTLECMPFNFYIMPHSFENLGMDQIYHSSVGSQGFLAQHKFDFNKLYYESVGYLSNHDHKRYLKIKEDRQQQQTSRDI